MIEGRRDKLIQDHFKELAAVVPGLSLTTISDENRDYLVRGLWHFTASREGESEQFSCEYQIDILLPTDYPNSPPMAKEVGGKLDRSFHVNPNGTLCLASPLALRKTFSTNPTLIGFVRESLAPFFYSYEYNKKYGTLPYGELAHGDEGIIEYYKETFSVTQDIKSLGLLRILADDNYRGHHNCPCGSRLRLRDCHGQILLDLLPHQTQNEFIMDYIKLLGSVVKGDEKIPKAFISNTLAKEVNLSTLEKSGKII